MKLSTSQRHILRALAAGATIRRNSIDKYELCTPPGKSGPGVGGPLLGSLRKRGYLTETTGVWALSDAGRAVVVALGPEA